MAAPINKIVFYNIYGLYLAGNPMIVGLYPDTTHWARYRIYVGETFTTLIFEGIVYSPSRWANVDISSVFAQYQNSAVVTRAKIVLVSDADVEYGSAQYISGDPIMTIYGGRISKLLMRRLAAMGTDIFDWKLKNSNTNFFLTTRTNDFVIAIPENELMPLYYYAQGMKFDVKANDEIVLSKDHTADTSESLQYIDFSALRNSLVPTKNKWINEFRIVTLTGWSCTVLITEAAHSDYFINFRNSWGAWERIAIQANANYTPTFSEPEISEKYDNSIGGLSTNNVRKEIQNIYSFSTAYKTHFERLHLIDMLLSQSTLLVADGFEYEVLVKSESTDLSNTLGTPVSVSLKIELLDADGAFSPILSEMNYNIISDGDSDITTDGANILI